MVHLKHLALLVLALPTAFSLAISNGGIALAITPDKETNAERLAKGLGPLAPTRRSTAGKVKRSAIPTSEDDPSPNDTTEPTLTIVHPSKRYAIRLRNPASNTDMGVMTLPNTGDGDLINFDPDTSRAEKFAFGRGGADGYGSPFDISPMGDDGLFGGGSSRLLGAMPGRHSDGPDLAQGSPNYCHIGLTHPDSTGLLSIHLPSNLLAHTPSSNSDTNLVSGLTHLVDGTPLGSGDDATWPAQSGIWTIHDRSSRLLAHYVNSDGNTVPTYFVTGGACQHLICLTADVDAFRNAYGQDAAEVHVLATVL